MADKKVVGLDNLKVFYNKLKDVFAPKLEGKNYLTSSTGDEGYTKAETDSAIKTQIKQSLNNGNGIININWKNYFNETSQSYNTIDKILKDYTYFYKQDDDYFIVDKQFIDKLIRQGTIDEQEFYFNDLLSYTVSPHKVLSLMDLYSWSYVERPVQDLIRSEFYFPYNLKDGSTTEIDRNKTYPDYFNYFTKEEGYQNYTPISIADIKTLINNSSVSEINKIIYTRIENSVQIKDLIDARIKDMVKSSSLQ